MNKLFVVLAASLLLSACASTPKNTSTQESAQPAASNAGGATLTQAEIDAQKLAAQLQALNNKSVYFDFDKFNVKPEFHGVMQEQADFIKSHSNDTVTLQGNADERGSNEYNLALGDKRATAVRKGLALMGVSAAQMKTVSFGEEKPRLTCHEEKCWKENRRVDFAHKVQ